MAQPRAGQKRAKEYAYSLEGNTKPPKGGKGQDALKSRANALASRNAASKASASAVKGIIKHSARGALLLAGLGLAKESLQAKKASEKKRQEGLAKGKKK